MKALLLAFTILLSCAISQAQYKIESKYDRFIDATTVHVYYLPVFKGIGRTIMTEGLYSYKGNSDKIEAPHEILLRFISTGSDEFNVSSTLYILSDDERRSFRRPYGDFVSPREVVIHVPFYEFEKLINGQKVEMRLDNIELDLSKDNLKALREFLPKQVHD